MEAGRAARVMGKEGVAGRVVVKGGRAEGRAGEAMAAGKVEGRVGEEREVVD